MSFLFQPINFRSVHLKNRLAVSPMCQYSSEDGFLNDWHFVHLGSRAVGGSALVFTEATAVSPEGRITYGDLGIWKDDHISGLKKITDFISAQNAIPGIQLAHAGRKASHQPPWLGGDDLKQNDHPWSTLAPSSIPFRENGTAPAEMTKEQISQCIDAFKQATIRSLKAGFKIIELHGAHGYLLHEFLSPLSNHRTDEYGGSFENRIRIIIEITEAVRSVWPEDYPLFVRLSASDWVPGGWTVEDSVQLSMQLKDKVDLIDCSSGGIIPGVKIPTGPLYQVPFSEKIKKETGIPTGAVGLITQPEEAENIIKEKKADLVLLARELLRDPYFPLRAAKALETEIIWPVQYERAR